MIRAPYLLVVDRAQFELEVWYRGPLRTRYRKTETFKISVGAEGHETPSGVYFVLGKIRNPPWTMPDASWVPVEKRGTVIPGGDLANPLKGAFLKITDDPTGAVGIHGTGDLASLGTAASHGCIRVDPEVAIGLHRRIPSGTPVVIL